MSTRRAAYYAVLDPLDPDVTTYWHRVERGRSAGQLQPWPPGTHYRPLLTRDVPAHLTKAERDAYARAYYEPVWPRPANRSRPPSTPTPTRPRRPVRRVPDRVLLLRQDAHRREVEGVRGRPGVQARHEHQPARRAH